MKAKTIKTYEDKIAEDCWSEGTTPSEIEDLLSKNTGKRFRLEIYSDSEDSE